MTIAARLPLGLKEPKAKPDPKHIARVKELPCVICHKPGPSDAHHVICGRYSQRRASDREVIPLCKPHHQWGPDAIHNGKASWVEKYGNDYDYLPVVADMLAGEWTP